jgi:uncharacterized protein with LGFP repeats
MRFFTRKSSKASESQPSARGGVAALPGASASARPTIETLESRQMFSITVPPIKFTPLPPAQQCALAMKNEYAATYNETDPQGNEVQLLLGSVTSSVTAVPGISGAFMETFHDHGIMFYSPTAGAHVIFGAIGQEYTQLANETDAHDMADVQQLIGLPTSDETEVYHTGTNFPIDVQSTFQGGTIYWSSATGAHAVLSAINQYYNNVLGGVNGPFGLPISDESGPLGNRSVTFQDGTIYWSPTGGCSPTSWIS